MLIAIKVSAHQGNGFAVQLVLVVVISRLNLLQGNLGVLVKLELEEIDAIFQFNYRINPTCIGLNLGVDAEPNQFEGEIEDRLIVFFVIEMEIVVDIGVQHLQNFEKLVLN